jgi:RNA polymerase sigma-70 factor (ECF subfamily)
MNAADEEVLLARVRRRDADAFTELVARYQRLVVGLIARTVCDPTRTEELAQEVFLRVYRGLSGFRVRSRLSTWIYRITANVCLQALGERRPVEYSLDAPFDGGNRGRPAWQPSAVDTTLASFDTRDLVEKAIKRLPPSYRLLVAGYHLEGFQYKELAKALDMPLGTVKTQLHRARRRLRQIIEVELSGQAQMGKRSG